MGFPELSSPHAETWEPHAVKRQLGFVGYIRRIPQRNTQCAKPLQRGGPWVLSDSGLRCSWNPAVVPQKDCEQQASLGGRFASPTCLTAHSSLALDIPRYASCWAVSAFSPLSSRCFTCVAEGVRPSEVGMITEVADALLQSASRQCCRGDGAKRNRGCPLERQFLESQVKRYGVRLERWLSG